MWLVFWFLGVGEIDRFEVPPDLGFMCDGFQVRVLSQGLETIVLITCCVQGVLRLNISCVSVYYYSIKVFPYIGVTRNRKKEIIQNLIQHEIGKDLKQINGNFLDLRSAKGQADSLSSAADSLSSWTRLWLGLVVAGPGRGWAWSWPEKPSLLVLVNGNPHCS